MSEDAKRVVLKKDHRVFVDGCDTGWTYTKTGGFHPEYILFGGGTEVKHYNMKMFKLKVLDFHNGCGEYL